MQRGELLFKSIKLVEEIIGWSIKGKVEEEFEGPIVYLRLCGGWDLWTSLLSN